jgi:hypothetical protein
VYSERINRKHFEAHHHGKIMSVSLPGIWSVASETYMSMVAWKSYLYRYSEVCYLINHLGYASLSGPESINIITVTWNSFTIFALEAFSFYLQVDTTFVPLTLLMNRDAMLLISCRGRGRSHRKTGQLLIFVLLHNLWFQEICVIYSIIRQYQEYQIQRDIRIKRRPRIKTKQKQKHTIRKKKKMNRTKTWST